MDKITTLNVQSATYIDEPTDNYYNDSVVPSSLSLSKSFFFFFLCFGLTATTLW